MINIFRKIRQQLSYDNKPGKYFRYAIGEIVLVVIGILIALQINNYNQSLKLNRQEQKALVNLKKDFEFNKEAILEGMKEAENTIGLNILVLSFTGSKERPATEMQFDTLMNQSLASPTYLPQNGFLNDLLNSGKLGIIRNAQLRNSLSSWKPIVDDLRESEYSTKEHENVFIYFIIKNGSWLNADQGSTSERFKHIKFPESGFQVDNRDLLGHLEFENHIENHTYMLGGILVKQNKTLEICNEILALINEEIVIY